MILLGRRHVIRMGTPGTMIFVSRKAISCILDRLGSIIMEGKEAAAPFATMARNSIKDVVLFIVRNYDDYCEKSLTLLYSLRKVQSKHMHC